MNMLVRKPPGNGPFPTVVFVHGLGMSLHEWNNSFDEIAERLNGVGILTVQFQFSIFTNGKTVELSLTKRAEIFSGVLAQVKKRNDVDSSRIGIFAQSYGAPTALCADLSFVNTFVSVGGTFFVKESIARVYTELGVQINYQGNTTIPPSSGENTTVTKEFWRDAQSFNPFQEIQQLSMPVLLLHGDQDTKVATEEVRRIYQAIPARQKKLKIFRGGDHGIIDVSRAMREEFLSVVVQWFHQTLFV